MADESSPGNGGESRSVTQKLKRSVETHVVVPLAVTVVGAATHYLIKKLPLILEEKVLPKLREHADAEGVRGAAAETAAAVGAKVADVAPDVEGGDADGAAAQSPARPKRRQVSSDEREQERKQREQRRGERRRSVQKA